ncbi:von Willebrand factor type A domain protein [Aquisphaera giovannonii]|uniref:von Willebrand factor type A domain protein n=1 Tax=Aquisphaera giovannonii TaxID=406548 RepID=A0A5B9W854_9BACT|nr:VWA domain-containing protein [Aquisphaera giovannonii]QEH36778.1 von Willebrand factor type A domain protein [Aquisphaera giovannonii]
MFGNTSLILGQPWWLALLPPILIPLAWMSYRSLSGLGPLRRALAIGLRAAVITLILLALAELQTVRRSDRLTTMFVIDASNSIPREQQKAAIEYVTDASRKRRKEDLAGVLVFGRAPRVEVPPAPSELNLLGIESTVDPENSDPGAALKLALATFPEDTARRVVFLSDGNENRGNLLEQALAAKALGVQVDVLPIEYRYDSEVLVEKVSIPPDVKKGETVNINVVVRASEPTRGTLQIFQKADRTAVPAAGNEKPVPVELERGVNVFTLKQLITEPNFYTFQAVFVPGEGSGDRKTVNNQAEGFTHARGKAQVLLIEGTKGEHAELVKALREKEIEVKALAAPRIDGTGDVGGDPLPTDLAQLQPYDAVILANVPKESFTESQHQLLASNCHDMGAGLLMLGGRESFGAGGWMNTPVEKALPVDMQIKALKVQGIGAMVLIMHASEIPEGNYWQKVVAKAAINALSTYDYTGMLHWEGQEAWLFTLRPIGTGRGSMLRAIDRMTPGDMPDFDPSLIMAMRGLNNVKDAMTKHIVVISDGDPTPPTSGVLNQLVQSKVTVTTVLTAAHGNDPGSMSTMRNLALRTKGRFYNVTNPRALPRIYQKEARTISRPLIFEQQTPWTPRLNSSTSELTTRLGDDLPGITGLVLTSPKENELVELPIVSPLPTGQVNPVLAHWTYGLGRSVAFTSDAGRRWAKAWPDWSNYAAFWSQVVRWAMRPADHGNLNLTVRREQGRIKIVVDALDKDNQFLNSLRIQGNVVDPALNPSSVELVQTAPGRYEATVENAEASGNYFVNLGYLGPGDTHGVISSGVSVPYSDEYRELKSNPAPLENLASLTDGEVVRWKTSADGRVDPGRTADGADHFRRDPSLVNPRSFAALWPTLLWLAACLFLADVAVRRIAPDTDRMRRAIADRWRRFRGLEPAPASDYMDKLRSRKAEVGEQLDRPRFASRFDAATAPEAPARPADEPLLGGPAPGRPRAEGPASSPPRGGLAPEAPRAEEAGYTNRLLKAKQRVWEEREKEKGNDKDKDAGPPGRPTG